MNGIEIISEIGLSKFLMLIGIVFQTVSLCVSVRHLFWDIPDRLSKLTVQQKKKEDQQKKKQDEKDGILILFSFGIGVVLQIAGIWLS